MTLQEFIDSASSQAIKDGLLNVKNNHFNRNEFLPDNNPLKLPTHDTIKQHFIGPVVFTPDEAKAYLASSSILHCFEGWNYLSASVHSLLNGEIPISIHLAYYAELRASSSFLSTEGIGIFDSHHFSICNDDSIIENPKIRNKNSGTHQFMWEALNCWIDSSNHSDVFNYFFYSGKSFNEWLQYIPQSNSVNISSIFLKEWLKDWSFDIDKFQKDRNARNFFSYRPNFNTVSNVNLSAKVERINSFWKTLEPDSSNRFSLLDKYLFKLFLEKIYFVIDQSHIILSFEDMIDKTFQNAGMSVDISLKQSIINNTNHSIFEKANDFTTDPNMLPDPLAIIARSILLLRLASGATAHLIKVSNISRQELDFFFNSIGIDGGFWIPGDAPNDFCDLWTDINDLIIDFEELAADSTITLNKIKDLNISSYSQFSRAAVWGTGL